MATPEDWMTIINQQPFEVRVPEFYQPKLPKYFEEHGVEPFHDSFANSECIGFRTAAEIIDLIVNEVPCKIVNENDVARLVDILDGYNERAVGFNSADPQIVSFLKRLRHARNILNSMKLAIERYRRNTTGRDPNQPLDLLEMLSYMK